MVRAGRATRRRAATRRSVRNGRGIATVSGVLVRGFRWSAGAGAMVTGVLLLVLVMPRVGASWDVTSDRIASVPVAQLWLLIAVWIAGLWAHTFVLQAALPGLTTRRAFALNLSGSSLSNVLPFGGAAGIGLNYAMLRSWGYSRGEITTFAMVTNLVAAAAKV